MVILKGEPKRLNAYTSAGAIKIGDFVTLNSSGQVAVATATQALVGVCMSYCSASGVEVMVADHPEQEFLVTSSSSTPSALTDFNLNYNIVANTTSGYEGNHTIDGATGATTATLPLKALAATPVRGSTSAGTFGASGTAVCIINNHQRKGGTGSAGV